MNQQQIESCDKIIQNLEIKKSVLTNYCLSKTYFPKIMIKENLQKKNILIQKKCKEFLFECNKFDSSKFSCYKIGQLCLPKSFIDNFKKYKNFIQLVLNTGFFYKSWLLEYFFASYYYWYWIFNTTTTTATRFNNTRTYNYHLLNHPK